MSNRILFITIILFISSFSLSGQDYIDSLETKLILVDNELKLEILDKLIPYYFRNEPLKAKKNAQDMLSFAMLQNDKRFIVKAQRYIGLSESRLTSDHEVALQKCIKVENDARSNGFFEEVVLTKLAIADIHKQSGSNARALESQIEAFHIADSLNFTHLFAVVLLNQAKTYISLEEFEKAELCIKSALKNAKISDQTEIIAEANILFGDLYAKRFNQELALEHYTEAEEIYSRSDKEMMKAITLFKIGECYFATDQMQQAFDYQLAALDIRKRIKDRTGLAESFNKIGLLFIENREYRRAVNNLLLGLKNAEKVNSNLLMQQSFDYLFQAYSGIDDYKNAVLYQKKYMEISELIFAEANERRIEEILYQNEIAKRALTIKNLEIAGEKKERELAASKKINALLALVLLISVTAVLVIVKFYRRKEKYAQQLKRSNEQISKQNLQLQELNSTKDKFFSIIGHDLKGPLNSLSAFAHLLIKHTASLTEEEIRAIARDLDKSLKNLYELLDNLLGWARSQTGKIELNPQNFRLTEAIHENVQLLSKAAGNKKIRIEVIVDEAAEAFADINSIKTVLRNLISNAIKFTGEEGIITVFADQWKDYVEIGIHDTGVGMSPDNMQKIFDISSKHSTLGTNREKGTGLGLILCKEFVEQNGGKISVESEVDVGTTFKFTLPVKRDLDPASES